MQLQPNDIAREAIKRLASRKQPPTPENFRRAYREVEGRASGGASLSEAIPALLAQWDAYQSGLTQARKREMLERVLINFGQDGDLLAAKLSGLARNWAESGTAAPAVAEDALPAGGEGRGPLLGPLVQQHLAELAGTCRALWPDLAGRIETLARELGVRDAELTEADVAVLGRVWREMCVRAEDAQDMQSGLRRVLALLFANIGELVSEDAWFAGQMAAMQAVLAEDAGAHAIFAAETSLRELVQQQRQVKGSLSEAKEKLRRLISTVIDRVGEMSERTGHYNARIKGYAARIAEAEDIAELGAVIDGLSADMAQMEDQMGRGHRDLVDARSQVELAETRIQVLERELEQLSSLLREDQLTGALNRRGLDESLKRELARADRMAAPFSIALLDIDHFKQLNDSLGHLAGDQALVHLAAVVRQLLRPTDAMARYGGEEFLLLLPNSDLDGAEKIMLRLQRELTRQFFLHDNRKLLITFSAGVAEWRAGEAQADLLGRADAAMYRAKASGRNRVERG